MARIHPTGVHRRRQFPGEEFLPASVDVHAEPAAAVTAVAAMAMDTEAPARQESCTQHRIAPTAGGRRRKHYSGGGRRSCGWRAALRCHKACLRRCRGGGGPCRGDVGGGVRPVLPVQQGGHRPAVGDRPERPAAEGVRDRRAVAEEVGAGARLRGFQQRHRILAGLRGVQGDSIERRRDRGGVDDQELRQRMVQALRNTVQEEDNKFVQS
uniref:Uncharacterized protein n=1 Tax=Arundo donax TaxID=35708 RepID=A0A0A8XSX4_ARUDO